MFLRERMRARKSEGKVSLVDYIQEGALGVEVGDYRPGPDLTAVGKLYADGRAVFNEDTSDLGVGLELSATGSGGLLDGVRETPHATLEDAVVARIAEAGGFESGKEEGGVVEGPGEERLDLLGLEELVEHVVGGAEEDTFEDCLVVSALDGGHDLGEGGRGGEHIGVNDAGGPHPEVDPFEVGVGIRGGDAGNLLGDLGVVVPDSDSSSVGEGVDAFRVDGQDFEAVGFEVEVLHNLAFEKEGGVGVAGKPVAGEYLVGESCAAEYAAALQGEDSEAGLGQDRQRR